MTQSQLRQTLEQLHAELDQAQTVDEESRQLMQHLMADIQTVLKEPSASARNTLRQRLDIAVGQFEESHPDLTMTIKQVLDHLAQV